MLLTSKRQTQSLFQRNLREVSKPTMKSGHDAKAYLPAGVSGQHNQPSHVPGQKGPKKWTLVSDTLVLHHQSLIRINLPPNRSNRSAEASATTVWFNLSRHSTRRCSIISGACCVVLIYMLIFRVWTKV